MREPVSSPFTSFLAQHFDQINDYLATFFDGQATSADIERYLYTPLSTFTANAGKRHRPLICFAACLAVGGNIVTDAFGVVAMVAMTPLITIQILGMTYQLKQRHASRTQQAYVDAFASLPEDAIIEL